MHGSGLQTGQRVGGAHWPHTSLGSLVTTTTNSRSAERGWLGLMATKNNYFPSYSWEMSPPVFVFT